MNGKSHAVAWSLPLGLVAAIALAPSAALADEMWGNATTAVVWEAEIEGYAVLTFIMSNMKVQRTGTLFVAGLQGNDQNRATFGGYWSSLDPNGPQCSMPIIDANGNEAWTWGQLELTFYNPAFPSGWEAALGLCFDPAVEFIAVDPITAGITMPIGGNAVGIITMPGGGGGRK